MKTIFDKSYTLREIILLGIKGAFIIALGISLIITIMFWLALSINN